MVCRCNVVENQSAVVMYMSLVEDEDEQSNECPGFFGDVGIPSQRESSILS